MKKRIWSRGVLTAVMAAAVLCAAGGCQKPDTEEPAEAVEPPGEAGTWRPGEWARVAILADGEYRVQQETTRDVKAVAGLLKKAGAVGAEPVVIDAPVEAGLPAVQTLRAALTAEGFALGWYQTGPVPTGEAGETFGGRFMAWAAEQGLDTSTAPVVVTGEVVSAGRGEEGADNPPARRGQWVTLQLHRCLKPEGAGAPGEWPKGWLDPAKHRYLTTDGGEGLWPGDKVLILLEEYDGGLAISPRAGGGCRLGVRLSGWDDPVIEAVRYAVAEGMDKALSHETYGPVLTKIGAVVAADVDQGE
ncbi:MAG: hypothetical protein NTV86_10665 [Planctomycetota bacterium]|nr:hypothetical protein [Planctomycetota bacterium]